MYDIQSGGAEIEYGYVVSIVSGGNKTYENIVRGKLNDKYEYCLNARIRNVFGGVSPARFVANSDMEYRCNNGYAKSVSIDALRRNVYSIIADDVLKIPEIAKVHKLNCSPTGAN